jgi:hypothetical protein
MRPIHPFLASVLLPALAHGLAAQPRQWIVDVQNRAGTDFTSLQTAFDTVPENDRVLIRDGTYPAVTLRRALVVDADPAVVFGVIIGAHLTVAGIPAGRRAVLSGFNLPVDFFTGFGSTISIVDCAGNVHLESLTCARGVSVERSHVVTLADVNTRLIAVDASIVVAGGSLRGVDSFTGFGGMRPATTGVTATRSSLTFSRCQIRGGGRAAGTLPGASAMSLTDSSVGVTGVSGNSISTGWNDLPAIAGVRGGVVIDPVITVSGSIEPSVPVTRRTVPSLDLSRIVRGQAATVSLRGDGAVAFGVLLSVPVAPVFVPGLNGGLAIDIDGSLLLGTGTTDGSGNGAFAVLFPGDSTLVGLAVAAQGVTVAPGLLLLSNAVARRIV